MSVTDLNTNHWNKCEEFSDKDVYKEANYYLSAAILLDKYSQKEQKFFPPVLMNVFFSCELFSKAILYATQREENDQMLKNKQKKEKIRGHNLEKMFNDFPDTIKTQVKANLFNMTGIDIDASDKRNFIGDISEAYINWRYRYEYKQNNCHWNFPFDYAEALKKTYDDNFSERF